MDTESKVATGLFVASMAVVGIHGFIAHGFGNGVLFLIIMLVALSIHVGLGLVACLTIAKVMGSSFGLLGHAIIKLAGIIAATAALDVLLPSGMGIVSLTIYLALLFFLFELEWAEVIGFALALWVLKIGVVIAIGSVLASMFAAG